MVVSQQPTAMVLAKFRIKNTIFLLLFVDEILTTSHKFSPTTLSVLFLVGLISFSVIIFYFVRERKSNMGNIMVPE